MRTLLFYLVPAVLIAVFIFLMATPSFFKYPAGQSDNIAMYISKVKSDVKEENWSQAASDQRHLEKAWKRVIPRIQIGIEKTELNHININLARLSGYIEAHGKPGALAELSELNMHWHHLGAKS